MKKVLLLITCLLMVLVMAVACGKDVTGPTEEEVIKALEKENYKTDKVEIKKNKLNDEKTKATVRGEFVEEKKYTETTYEFTMKFKYKNDKWKLDELEVEGVETDTVKGPEAKRVKEIAESEVMLYLDDGDSVRLADTEYEVGKADADGNQATVKIKTSYESSQYKYDIDVTMRMIYYADEDEWEYSNHDLEYSSEAVSKPSTKPGTSSGSGKVLNIYCWNDEFARRMADHMPGYESNDAYNPLEGGYIGDVEVRYIVNYTENNQYQDALYAALLEQSSAADEDKVDIFLVEADYAASYLDNYALSLFDDLDFANDAFDDQFKYVKQIGCDSNGILRAVSWQSCPSVMIYNRTIAKEVIGTDNPADVQNYVKDWNSYNKLAGTMKAAGHLMTASCEDTFRTYSNNKSVAWVTGNKINVDANLVKWAKDTKALYDSGCLGDTYLWDGYSNLAKGGAFCTFGPAWLVDYCMGYYSPNPNSEYVAEQGNFGIVNGPQSSYWGGTWICGAVGSDNKELIASIMESLCCDYDTMKDIQIADNDFVNNALVAADLADSSDISDYVLGGINPVSFYLKAASSLELNYITPYDSTLNELFSQCMLPYIMGQSSYDSALNTFYDSAIYHYPNLRR